MVYTLPRGEMNRIVCCLFHQCRPKRNKRSRLPLSPDLPQIAGASMYYVTGEEAFLLPFTIAAIRNHDTMRPNRHSLIEAFEAQIERDFGSVGQLCYVPPHQLQHDFRCSAYTNDGCSQCACIPQCFTAEDPWISS